jgi:hypothetical protein
MMSSPELTAQARQLLDHLIVQLDENHLYHLIDEPIDRVALLFTNGVRQPTRVQLRQAITACLRRIDAEAIGSGGGLSDAQAHDEAVFLLQNIYQGTMADGYEAAYLDARSVPEGLKVVIHQFAESLKAWRRQLHLRWVKSRLLDNQSWEVRCRLAEILLDELSPYLPTYLPPLRPWQFADNPLQLLGTLNGTTPQATLAQSRPKMGFPP